MEGGKDGEDGKGVRGDEREEEKKKSGENPNLSGIFILFASLPSPPPRLFYCIGYRSEAGKGGQCNRAKST